MNKCFLMGLCLCISSLVAMESQQSFLLPWHASKPSQHNRFVSITPQSKLFNKEATCCECIQQAHQDNLPYIVAVCHTRSKTMHHYVFLDAYKAYADRMLDDSNPYDLKLERQKKMSLFILKPGSKKFNACTSEEFLNCYRCAAYRHAIQKRQQEHAALEALDHQFDPDHGPYNYETGFKPFMTNLLSIIHDKTRSDHNEEFIPDAPYQNGAVGYVSITYRNLTFDSSDHNEEFIPDAPYDLPTCMDAYLKKLFTAMSNLISRT